MKSNDEHERLEAMGSTRKSDQRGRAGAGTATGFDYPSRWTVVAYDRDVDEMILRTPCCEQAVRLGAYCFDTDARDVRCEGCEGRYDVIFKGSLGHGATAGWTPQ